MGRLETFSQLASSSANSRYLTTVFSRLASDRARSYSLVLVEARRSGLPRVLGTLLSHERELTVVVLLWFVICPDGADSH